MTKGLTALTAITGSVLSGAWLILTHITQTFFTSLSLDVIYGFAYLYIGFLISTWLWNEVGDRDRKGDHPGYFLLVFAWPIVGPLMGIIIGLNSLWEFMSKEFEQAKLLNEERKKLK